MSVTKSVLLLILVSVFLLPVQTNIPDTSNNLAIAWVRLHLRVMKQLFRSFNPITAARAFSIASYGVREASVPFVPRFKSGSVVLQTIPKRPKSEQTLKNIEKAISYASLRLLLNLYGAFPHASNFTNFFRSLGFDDSIKSEDLNTPEGIGNYVARVIISEKSNDGSNQYGNNTRSTKPGVPYSPWDNYFPVNDPPKSLGKTYCGDLRNRNHWQPLRVPNRDGTSFVQEFGTASGIGMAPFSQLDTRQLRRDLPLPALYGTPSQQQQIEEVQEIVDLSSQLNDTTKMIAELWADGPDSTYPPGHWHLIATLAAEAHNISLVETIEVLFLQSVAACDAGFLCWELKRIFDTSRPITLIRCYNENKTINAWRGPYMGVGAIQGEEWIPYQDQYFVTPAFPEYPSGHSSFSFACATVLKNFFGSDEIDISYTIKKGESSFEPYIGEGQPGFIKGVTDVPNTGPASVGYSPANDVVLRYRSFSEAATTAGNSRRYGGIHLRTGDFAARQLGQVVGAAVWEKYITSLVSSDDVTPTPPPSTPYPSTLPPPTPSPSTPSPSPPSQQRGSTVININFAHLF